MDVSYMAIPSIKGGKIIRMIFSNKPAFVDTMIKTVCRFYELDETAIMSKTRKGEVVLCRHVIAYLMKMHTNMTDEQIGDRLDKDRSSIIHAVQSIRYRMDNEHWITEDISSIRTMLVYVDK